MEATVSKKNIVRDLFEKGARTMLEEAQVPQHIHVAIVTALVAKLKAYENNESKREQLLTELRQELRRSQQLAKGENGRPGNDADEGRVIKMVLSKIKVPKNGKDADEKRIINEILKRIPTPQDGLTPELDLEAIASKVRPSTKLKDIEGLDERLTALQLAGQQRRNGFSFNGRFYKFEELMHGGGGTSGGGFTIIAVTGTINDSNVTFTAASQPTLLNINGAFYQKTGGAITWTYSGGTITLSGAVGTGGSIFGV